MPDQDTNAFGYFLASSPNLPLRQKLALAMMAKNKKFPTNLGEGIASVGQSFADAIMQRATLDDDRAAQQNAATATVPPIADAAVPPTAPPQASVVRDSEPNIVPAQPQQASVIRPAPIPSPNGQLGNRRDTVFPTHSNGLVQPQQQLPLQPPPSPQQAATPPTVPPVMAQGGSPADVPPAEEARRAIGQALLRQQMGGAPSPAPTEPQPPAAALPRPTVADYGQPSALAPTPPPQAIPAAPPQQPIRAIPPQEAQQPEAIAGYVPPAPDRPQGAPTIQPGRREQQLQAFMAANSGNPYMAQSQPARELQVLQQERERKQKEADELFKADVSRGTKQHELNLTGRMTQDERQQESQRRATELKYQEQKLREEGLKRQQELVGGGVSQQGPDPYLGTPQSGQRSGRPEIPPAPKGAIPEVWVKDQQAKIAKTAETLDSAKPELAEALDLINKARAHPAKEKSLGSLGGLAKLTPEGQGFAAIMDQLKGKTFLSGYQKLKGTGNVSEIEGLKTEQAQARLATAQTQKDFDDALQDLEGSLRGGVERVERKMNRPVTAYQKTPDDPYAPDLGQVGTRGGKKVEYIGGDPSKDSSYKTVR